MTDKAFKQANDIAVGVDVTQEGTHVVAMRLRPNGVNEVIYSQFHPLSQQEAKDEPWEKFCDSHCVWTDHHPDCKLAKDETVACWCHKCNENELVNGIPFAMTRMILCPNCGNKRCPKASDHTLQCTNSNEPNQAGSVYTTPPQRKPLTDEQAMDAYVETPPFGTYKEAFIAGIRFIEAAHGIKG